MVNVSNAISFNNACNYNAEQIKIILRAVGAAPDTQWTAAGVTAVANWQRAAKLDVDGMVGLASLKKIIEWLTKFGNHADANTLNSYLAAAKASQAAKKAEIGKVVQTFTQQKVVPFRFEKEHMTDPQSGVKKPSWAARCTFEVVVKLNPALSKAERTRYEYRQYIKGSASVEDGHFNNGVWSSAGPVVSIASRFEVPGDPKRGMQVGLTPAWKEDGKEAELGGAAFRFGHRDGAMIDKPRFKNKWWPDRDTGPNLLLQDSPGYSEIYRQNAPRVRIDVQFCGQVVEVTEVELADGYETQVLAIVESKYWSCQFDQTLRW